MLKATQMKNYLSKVLAYRINDFPVLLTRKDHANQILIIDHFKVLGESIADEQKNVFFCLNSNILLILGE